MLIESEEQFIYLSRYIHRNILEFKRKNVIDMRMLASYQPSSYPDYLGIRHTTWLHPEEILKLFPDEKHIKYLLKELIRKKRKTLARLTIDE